MAPTRGARVKIQTDTPPYHRPGLWSRSRSGPRRGDCAPLAGKSTLNRLELAAAGRNDDKARKIVVDTERLDRLVVALFVESYGSEPEEVVLDVDATDIPLHGGQEERFYHGYYREYC